MSCSTGATGGGVFIDVNTTASLTGASFVNNTASDRGGGFFSSSSTVVTGANLQFSANHASSGGALAAGSYSSASLASCSFSANSVSAAGGALLGSGAAAVTVQNGIFSSNVAAGFAPRGGAASLENVASVTLSACTFANNAVTEVVSATAAVVGMLQQLVFAGSQDAGAIFLGNSPLVDGGQPTAASISNTTFQSNSAPGAGGALMVLAQNNLTLAVSSCVFSSNTAGSTGGAMTLSGAVVAAMTSCTYASNAAGTDGGAVALLDGCVTTSSSNAYSSNAALAGHGGAMLLQGTAGASTSLSGDTLSGNAALFGGAIALSGAAHSLTAASPATVFNGNTATYGSVFSLAAAAQPISGQLSLTNAAMSNNTASAGAAFFSDVNVGQPACAGCVLSNNTATNYGAVSTANPNGFATPPVTFSVASPANLSLGSACGIVITMADAYQNTIMSWPGFSASLLPTAALSGSLLAGSYAGGNATVANAVVNAPPATDVAITVTVTSPPLGSAAVNVTMLQCGVNQLFQATTNTCECIRGAFQPVGSSEPCTLCPAGTFAPGIGEVACTACAATAVSGVGSPVCLTCPDASHPLTDDLCVCETNYYGLFTDTNNGTCTACPANAVCQDGVIVADQGYWKSSSASIDIQQCLEPEACMFDGRSETLLALTSGGSDEDTIRAAQCWGAYTGPLCSKCAPGFGRDTDLRCGICPSFQENTGKLAATSFTNLVSVLLTIRTNMAGGVSPPLHSQIIKIMLNYLTVTSLASRVPLQWPKRIEEMLAVQATATHSGGKVVAIECSLPQRERPKFYDLVSGYLILVPVAGLCAPLAFWVLWYAGPVRVTVATQHRWARYAAEWARQNEGPQFKLESLPVVEPEKNDANLDRDSVPPLKKQDAAYEKFLTNLAMEPLFREKEDYGTARKRCKSYFIICVVVVLFYLWTPVTSAILHLFVCVEIDPQTPNSPFHGLFLQQDTSEMCWQNRHLGYLLGGALVGAIIVVLGIPVCSGLYLWANRHRLTDPTLNLRLGFLYYGYKKDACYYESVIMIRKLALVVVTVFFNHGAPYSGAYVLAIMLGTMFCSFFVHARLMPYEERILEQLERYSMSASIMTLWIGLFFYLGTPYVVEVVLTIVLAGINAVMCIAFVACILSEFVHARVIASMPPGSTRASVKAHAMADHCIYHEWPKVKRTKVQWKRTVHAWFLIEFVRWLDHAGNRSAKEMDEVLHAMHASADAAERKRRNELIAKWASAGLIRDDEIAAWVCWYEGANRDAATLAALIERSTQREKDLDARGRRIKLPTAVLGSSSSSKPPSALARLLATVGLSSAPTRPPPAASRISKAVDVERAGGCCRPPKASAPPAVACEPAPPVAGDIEAVPEAALPASDGPPDQAAPAGAAEDQKKK